MHSVDGINIALKLKSNTKQCMCNIFINLNPCCYDVLTTVISLLASAGGSVYAHLIGLSSQDTSLLTTLSCENEHLLAVRVMYIF